MSWSSFVSKCRHFFTSADVSGPTAVVCNCPNCGHVVMTVFVATKDRIQAVNQANTAPRSEKNGDPYTQQVLQERRDRAADREKRPLYRTKDQDLRDQPDV